jgi:hypothetical protein
LTTSIDGVLPEPDSPTRQVQHVIGCCHERVACTRRAVPISPEATPISGSAMWLTVTPAPCAASRNQRCMPFRDFFWPHGRAALRLVGLTDKHAKARTVLRWLRLNPKGGVSREEIRREALGRRFDAEEVQELLDLLVRAGWLRGPLTVPGPGRHAKRWEVNPRLFQVPL